MFRLPVPAAVALALGATLSCAACGRGDGAATSSATPRVVTLTTHSSPGGGSDVFLREMAPFLSRVMGTTVIVENLQGGSGARALAALGRAKPDGSTFYATTPTYIYTSLLSTPEVTFRDVEPLVNIFFDPEVLYTAADARFTSLAGVLEHARSGQGRWGAANPASLERQVLERIKQKAGVSPVIATYEGGGDMLVNVLNHTLDMGVGELQEIRGQLDAKTIRLLAVVGESRIEHFPDLPTAREQGVDVAVRKFRGLAGPKGTPPEVIARLEAAVPQLLADPHYKAVYTANNLQPGFLPHAEYVRFIDEFGRETEAFFAQSGVLQ